MRRRDDLTLGNFYHAALYDPQQSPPPREDKITTINQYQGQDSPPIRRETEAWKHRAPRHRRAPDRKDDPLPLIRRRRRVQCTITSVHDAACGMPTTTTKGIVNVFRTSLRLKYSPLQVADDSIRNMAEVEFSRMSVEWRNTLVGPLTSDELRRAIIKGNYKKAPGCDGIGLRIF
jgi:hypothetical protein